MDAVDKKILNMLQHDFPLEAQPFSLMAARVGLDEAALLERVGRLKQAGVIRRIGAIFDTGQLGFTSTLCAAKVPDARVKEFVEIVNAYPGVTHNYLRDHRYNVWFTFIGASEQGIRAALSDIAQRTGISDIINMPVRRRFKIDARFQV